MALDDETRDRLQLAFPSVGVPHDATDWLDAHPDSPSMYLDQVAPVEDEALEARRIMLESGIPSVYFRAIESGVTAYDEAYGDQNPNTQWFLGAHLVG